MSKLDENLLQTGETIYTGRLSRMLFYHYAFILIGSRRIFEGTILSISVSIKTNINRLTISRHVFASSTANVSCTNKFTIRLAQKETVFVP